MPRAVVTHALRTPIGKFLGQFKDVPATDLWAAAGRAVLAQAGVHPDAIDDAFIGCARQAGLGPNPARQAVLKAGCAVSVPATTVNMACGSGLKSIILAAQSIALGDAKIVFAGGMESMTRVPFLLPEARLGYRIGHAKMVDAMYQDGFHCPMADQLMGETAETLARQYGISRTEQDEFAARSHARAAAAAASHAEDIVKVSVPGKGGPREVSCDEQVRGDLTAAKLGALPAVFDTAAGTVTAGNASGITDGAAALLLMEESEAQRRGLTPLATFEAWSAAGVDPKVMGLGPVPAVRRLEAATGLRLDQFDLVELNEAFAAQALACDRELKFDPERMNVNGGAIALGHPIGSTGARIVVTLLHELRRRQGKLGLATLCISGGQGLACAFRRAN
ncbi:MAG: thiolase family protein [Planctomycetes bacterium]|nr:thiolase family protein [Planctomycetota bacterium]